MNKKNFNKNQLPEINFSWQRSLRGTLVLIIICGALLTMLLLPSCKEQKKEVVTVVNKDVYYTCSMHPQVHEDHPGNCPICGMKLIAVKKAKNNMTNMASAMQIQLSPEQIRLGNIQTDTIGKGTIGSNLVLTGTLNFNQDKLASVSARIEGRLERLYFKNVGDYVAKGTKLYALYSEQLNNAKQEYIHAVEQESTIGNTLINYAALVESAKNKLLLWGMTKGQIAQLAKSKEAPTLTTFYSTESGYITAINVNEGEYVMEGGTVVQLANLSTLWAEAQVYTTQMTSISKNEVVSVQIPDLNQSLNGKIDFVNPEINPNTRINLVRVVIPNKNNQLHPGMPVYITISKQKHNSITLPSDAVLRDSKGATVWVQIKPGVYEIRMVKTGIAENNAIEITEGLKEGDVVVTNGAYLVNSEYVFQHGSDPMAGMKM
ncbi:MAG: efflux RND transporter periplasmic adaptor subunit [Bacteroidetes bacterium]|jgi:Cu(I)/Ag(I) efflux system membrane fusion protein|uniref:efflux RND transporter periplasmic adaptor subunit n=1 Tax=uncultured Dysgonomonas sp. TaxID=206096 RepID=UPI001AD4FE42|nr:efflux RND transporter periplasmic adaptor subunit [uncultured Dysgonomonas sp.]MBN9484569.1 efflux RND transporter periplasmic adaptor subunit [Bacteroidota bacterium]